METGPLKVGKKGKRGKKGTDAFSWMENASVPFSYLPITMPVVAFT
jgi:hypothetical protein